MTDISKLPKPVDLAYVKIEPSTGLDNNKNPVVIYHGIFSNKENWTSIGREIAEKTKRVVYCFDIRDHGESPFTNEFIFQSTISDMVHFLNKNKIENAVFIGHSLGGMIFSRLATLFPNLVEKLVIVDIHPKKKMQEDGKPNFMKMFIMSLKTALDKMRDEKMDLQSGKAYLNDLFKAHMKDGQNANDFAEKLTIRDGQISFRFNVEEITNFLGKHEKMEDITPNFNGNVLEIYGGKSIFFTKDDCESMLKMFPNCRFECVEDGDHVLHSTHPKEFVETVVPFLNE